MSDLKVERLLKWINNTGEEEVSNPSSHSFISPKLTIENFQSTGRGLGASSPINRNENIIKIPHSFLLNTNSIIRHIAKHNDRIKLTEAHYLNIYVPYNSDKIQDKFTDIYTKLLLEELLDLSSVQLMSLYLLFEFQRGKNSFWKPFIDVLPSVDDFILSPLIWEVMKVAHHEELLSLLPKSVKKHTSDMLKRFTSDFKVVKSLIAKKLEISSDEIIESEYLPKDKYLWVWMCINSRCLYMNIPQSKNKDDNFTMAPYVDILNHSCDDQCGIKIDVSGFLVYTTSRYEKGQQLFFSYGPHSNVFLLCEYGFTLPENSWNYLDMTDYISPLLKPSQVDFLKEHDYYGDYTINALSGISFRTEVAFAVLQENIPHESRKLAALINGYSDGSGYKRNTVILISKILEKVIFICDKNTKLEFSNDDGSEYIARKKTIGTLYRDMKNIASTTIQNMD